MQSHLLLNIEIDCLNNKHTIFPLSFDQN